MIQATVLETPHVVVGAAIATKVANPALSLPLALASHFILEKIPHWNPHLNTETEKFGRPTTKSIKIVIVDVILALTAGSLIASRVLPNINHALIILAASFTAALPDIIEGPYFFLGLKNKTIKRWINLQKSIQSDASLIPGLFNKLITVAAALVWIIS